MLNSVRNEGTTSAHSKLFLINYTVTYLQKFRYLLEVPQEFINRYYSRTYRWVVLGFFCIVLFDVHRPWWEAPSSTEGIGWCPCEALSTICECSWWLGEMPKFWRKTNVISTFKKVEKKDPRELHARQPHLKPLDGEETMNPSMTTSGIRFSVCLINNAFLWSQIFDETIRDMEQDHDCI